VSPVELTDRERGGREGGGEAKSCDGKKAWCSINHSILSCTMNKRPELGVVFRYLHGKQRGKRAAFLFGVFNYIVPIKYIYT
jgi:hypothetical protein